MPPSHTFLHHAHITIELDDLTSRYDLGLVTIAGTTASEEPKPVPVQWVHSSDLKDPSPFLTPRTVLLTTGTQFSEQLRQAEADAYVHSLLKAGVCALGFAVGVSHDRIPQTLINACDRAALPLLRVPYDTPFIAISQTAARMLSAKTYARDAWNLETQKAVSVAALATDGIESAVHELAARLARWVVLTDRHGRVLHSAGTHAMNEADRTAVRTYSAELLARGLRSSRIYELGDTLAEFQTLGQGKRLLGVLVIERDTPLDHAEQSAVSLLATLATVQLDSSNTLADATALIQDSLLRLLVEGDSAAAQRLAESARLALPQPPLRVLSLGDETTLTHSYLHDARSFFRELHGPLFGFIDGELAVLIGNQDTAPARQFVARWNRPAGISLASTVAELDEALGHARRAREVAEAKGGIGIHEYQAAMSVGVLGLLAEQPGARERASELLAPLHDADGEEEGVSRHTLKTWLSHHGAFSTAAADLGIHRHTLRTRIEMIGTKLQRDLQDPDVRAELWAALRLLS